MKHISTELKVGIFAAVVILILAWATVRVGDKTSVAGRGYVLAVSFENASGLKVKAPVELSGVQIGVVKDIELVDSRRAEVKLLLSKEVSLPEDSTAILRTRGFLGETYVEIVPGDPDSLKLKSGDRIVLSGRTGDINSMVGQFNAIADDIKHITGSLKGLVGDDDTAPINRIVTNLDDFTKAIREITIRNEQNVNRITDNMAAMTEQLREVVARGRADVEESMQRIASITRKVDEGKGTVGRLINDEETIDKLNEAVDSLNETLGGFRKIETEIGYHAEYLTKNEDFKHYVSLALKPAPDKAFMFDVVTDPDPRPTHVERTIDVTAGGNTTRVTTETATIDREKVRFSAQLAKKFYDFTLRGGLIESTGGVGLDYETGPLGLRFSAFDFSTRFGERPHLKAWGDLSVTKNFYLLGGTDDIISRQDQRDWFFGAGFRLVDEDVKSLARFGGRSLLGK